MAELEDRGVEMHLLLYTNLYPGADAPRRGIFVEERLRQLTRTGRVTASVCALRPVVSLNPLRWLRGRAPSTRNRRHGVPVSYLEVPTLPFVTNWIDPWVWAWTSKRAVRKLVAEADGPVILDAHFLYPDGAAAALLGQWLDLPVVMTARGSDVNVKATNLVMRRWIQRAVAHCEAVVTVSAALKARLCELGVPADKLHALPNGVDLEKFDGRSTRDLRAEFGLSGPLIASVGHLIEGKGHHIVIEALTRLQHASLIIAGDGPDRKKLEKLAESRGVASRVRFLGGIAHDDLPGIYGNCDLTVLASANEGMPNVILESIACGTPVVATNVGGVHEVLTAPEAGCLMESRTAAAVANCVQQVLDSGHDRQATREFARRFDWAETVRRQLTLYEEVVTA